MTMRWEELTGDTFPEEVERCGGVCLVALSVLERHGHHLPLGTDMYQGRAVLERAAQLEPAILFPDHVYTQISEARHLPGTVSLDGDVVLSLLDNVCREIARNGLKKIVLVNAHGGNRHLIPYFLARQRERRCDYVVYGISGVGGGQGGQRPEVPWDRAVDGHAGPGETSMMLAIRPDLVHLDRVPAGEEWRPRGRLRALREAGAETGMFWYADYPTHYAGDAHPATAEAGERLLDARAAVIARAVRAVKADSETARLQETFHAGAEHPAP
jgi:creatinine amidohydrolase